MSVIGPRRNPDSYDTTAEAKRASRMVRDVAMNAGLTEEGARRLMEVLPDLLQARMLDPQRLAESLELDPRVLTRVRNAAQLSALPGVTIDIAVRLSQAGLDLDTIARGEAGRIEAAVRAGGLEAKIPPETLAAWTPAAVRILRLEMPGRVGPVRPPHERPSRPAAVQYLTVDETADFSTLARKHYDVRGGAVERVARALANANARRPDEVVDAGTRLVLPALTDAPFRPTKETAEGLSRFAAFLDRDEATALVQAGFTSTASLSYLDVERDMRVPGLSGETLRRLQLQSTLSRVKSLPPEVAHALAAVSDYENAVEMAQASPAIVRRHLMRAAGLGFIDATAIPDEPLVAGWLADLADVVVFQPLRLLEPADPICPTAPPTAAPQNFYSYRLTPVGRTATALASDREDRLRLFNKLGEALLDPAVQADSPAGRDKARQLEREVMRACGITWADLEKWGLDPLTNTTAMSRLGNLQRYLGEQRIILDLLVRLAEAHEAYNRGEYQLALTAYQRIDQWFNARVAETAPGTTSTLSLLWDNRTQGGQLVSPFVEPQPAGLGQPAWEAWKTLKLSDVHSYYLDRANPARTLDDLQITFADYNKFMLHPFDVQLKTAEPFRKYLYYLRNFAVPLSKSDISLRLGNFCLALEHAFRVHEEPTYVDKRSPADETHMARRLLAGTTYPEVDETGLDSGGYNRYYFPYLNEMERRVVDLRVARIYREWGEHHERTALPWVVGDPGTRRARARYAQCLRVVFPDWKNFRDASFARYADFQAQMQASNANPLALDHAFAVDLGLMRLDSKLNFLGFTPDYVPIWTYAFLLNSARYFAGQAKQLERDALAFLASAEQELGNQRLLVQQIATSSSQLDVEARRVDEAVAGIGIAQAGVGLAEQRVWNSVNRQIELEALGPVRVALGSMGGIIGGAGSGAGVSGGNPYAIAGGAVVGGITSYLSGQLELDMQLNELGRQQLEMERGRDVANAELARAQISASIARMLQNIAAANLAFAQSNLEFVLTKTLNADFWFEASKRLRDFAERYLVQAIQVAFLAEQAFEFAEGRRVDRVKFNYVSTEQRLAADALLTDLDSIEAERIVSRRSKRMPVRHLINLRQRDFEAFERLRRTGTVVFDTVVSEFDLAYAGSHMYRIVDVEVEVRALTGPAGIRGTLTKHGLSYVRFRDPRSDFIPGQGNVAPDWIQHTPTIYRVAPVVQPDETLILSSFDVRRDQVVLRGQPPGEELGVFEGSGLATNWRLTISPCDNEFDLSTVTDVNVIFYYSAQFDPQLARIVELERRKLIGLGKFTTQKSKGYSFRESLPDQFYQVLNSPTGPATAPLRRTVAFRVRRAEFPPNETSRVVDSLVLAFMTENGPIEAHPRLSSATHSPGYDPTLDNRAALVWVPNPGAGETIVTDPALPFPVMATTAFNGQSPEDLWFLEIVAEDNPALARTDAGGNRLRFRVDVNGDLTLDAIGQPIADPAGKLIFDPGKLNQLKDIWWILRYRYEIAGRCGDPVVLWSHFGVDAQAHFAKADHTVGSTPWSTVALSGVGNWVHATGQLRHQTAGASIAVPTATFDWQDLELFGVVGLPSEDDREAGVIVRYSETAGPHRFYRLRLINSAAAPGRVDVRMEKVQGPIVTMLAQRDQSGLGRGVDHQLSLFVRGITLQAFVDGVPLLVAQDGDIVSGAAGLYASGVGTSCTDLWVSDLTGRP